jgi:glycosyltransferase involved in cell wall biosynthesis
MYFVHKLTKFHIPKRKDGSKTFKKWKVLNLKINIVKEKDMLTKSVVSSKVFAQETRANQSGLTVSVVVPTRNEAGNVEKLLTSLKSAFYGTVIEVIFVDDSTDETPQVVMAATGKFPAQNVRLIHRSPEERVGGLGGAVVAGLKAARADYVCVMDGDLQHPPEVAPVLLKTAIEEQADLVVATRRSEASQVSGLSTTRNLISRGLDLAARLLFYRRLHGVSDPLTGFFLVRVKGLNLDNLRPKGFKILLEILVRNPNLRKAEVPFSFAERFSGQSKASTKEAFKYLHLLWSLRFGDGSLRFLGFALIGVTGILVNSLFLFLATDKLHIYFLISAAIATVASTLWNFSLTEAIVYRAGSMAAGRLKRLGLFFIVNVIALGLRTPMIYVMTSMLKIYYIYSNLISLALLTVVRFMVADNAIWGKASSNSSVEKSTSIRRLTMKKSYAYNIHDIVTVLSEGELPELEPFRVMTEIKDPTIQVTIGIPRALKPGEDKAHYMRYREIFGHLGFEVGIEIDKEKVKVVAAPMLRYSPHVLYTNVVEPLLRWTFVKRGYALVHGATIAFGDAAYMITARTDTGKTTTLLKILAYQRRDADQAAFISDDMTIVSPDGMALTYPKPLTISYHTLRAVNTDTLTFWEKTTLPFQSRIHSRSGRRFAFVISKTHLPAATINMITQMVVPPPKYFVNKLVSKVKLSQQACLTGMFIIERGKNEILPIENSEAMEVLLTNCEDAYGFPPYEDVKEFLYCYDNEDLHVKEQAIIRQAMDILPARVIRSDSLDWWSMIPSFVNDESVSRDISRALLVESVPQNRLNGQPERVSVR